MDRAALLSYTRKMFMKLTIGADTIKLDKHSSLFGFFISDEEKQFYVIVTRQNNWKWLVIADDDTLLSVAKLMDAIQCYDKVRV
jgi:hypothetical protein